MADEEGDSAGASSNITSQQGTDEQHQHQTQAAGSAPDNNAAGDCQEINSSCGSEENHHNNRRKSGSLSSGEHASKDGKSSKKSPSPTASRSHSSLTVQERQARAEKLRKQKVTDLKKKENDRRAAFEERRKKLLAEENAKREALLKKLESGSPKPSRPLSRGSFGSAPRPVSASTSNLSHLKKARNASRSIDISPRSTRSKSGSLTGKEDLPKRPSSAMTRPRSSLYLPKRPTPTRTTPDANAATLGGKAGSRSPSSRSSSTTGRPQSAFGSCSVREVAERPRGSSVAAKPLIKKNLQPASTTGAKAKPQQDRGRSSSFGTSRPASSQPTAAAKAKPTRPKTPSATKTTRKSTATTTAPKDADTAQEIKKKVIRRTPATTKTTTTVKTTTTTSTTPKAGDKQAQSESHGTETTTEEVKTVVESTVAVVDDEAEREAKRRDELAELERIAKEREEQALAEAEQHRKEEERERKAKEELERRAAEREQNKKIEEEARLERKKRVEMIMAKVAGKKDSNEAVPVTPSTPVAPEEQAQPIQQVPDASSPESETTKQRVDKILQRVKGNDGASSDSSGEMSPDSGMLSPEEPVATNPTEDKLTNASAAEATDPASLDSNTSLSGQMLHSELDVELLATALTENMRNDDNTKLDSVYAPADTADTTAGSEYVATSNGNVVADESAAHCISNGLTPTGNHNGSSNDTTCAEEERLWKDAENTMKITLNNDEQGGLDIMANHDKQEETKLWQVAEGQLELSECF